MRDKCVEKRRKDGIEPLQSGLLMMVLPGKGDPETDGETK